VEEVPSSWVEADLAEVVADSAEVASEEVVSEVVEPEAGFSVSPVSS